MEDEDLMSIFDSGMELNYDEGIFVDESTEDPIIDENKSVEEIDDKNIKQPVEEEDPENVDGEDDNEGDDPDVDASPNLYSSISNVLFEQGIIPSLESADDIKTSEDFVNIFKKEIDIQSSQKLEMYLENIDLEKIAISKKTQLELESINEDYLKDNLEVAKDIIYRDYINQGLSEDRAKKMLRKTIDLGEEMIIEDAIESVQSLKDFEKRIEEYEKVQYKERIAEQIKEQEDIDKAIKSNIYTDKPIIEGITVNKALQDKVFKTMTEVVAKDPKTGEMQNKFMQLRSLDPIAFDTKMYCLFTLTDGFTNLKNISNTVTSKAVKNLESALRKTKFEDNGLPGFMNDPDSYNGIGSELVF